MQRSSAPELLSRKETVLLTTWACHPAALLEAVWQRRGWVAVDMTNAATELILTLTGELVEGRYEDEQVHECPSPVQCSITVHTLIEQKGQENAGAPVG